MTKTESKPTPVGVPAGNGTEYSPNVLLSIAKQEIKRTHGKYIRHTIRVTNYGASLWIYYIPANSASSQDEHLYTYAL